MRLCCEGKGKKMKKRSRVNGKAAGDSLTSRRTLEKIAFFLSCRTSFYLSHFPLFLCNPLWSLNTTSNFSKALFFSQNSGTAKATVEQRYATDEEEGSQSITSKRSQWNSPAGATPARVRITAKNIPTPAEPQSIRVLGRCLGGELACL